ncbi:hypothetical protein GBAR_LOCUS23530 [Geodia barretti]|uniref:Uncharacterized protein n=1 Tax=Geodia barretti TaxID=519541 RepID=A0AA35T5V3_GEOBA|nr:hypothetical protein GBAR_LOCUS23530 [Geodia barretti]
MSSLLLNTPPRCRSSSYGGRDGSYSWPATPSSSPLPPAASPLSTDPGVEELVKRLEETCERVSRDAGISVMKNDPDSAAFIPLRVKEIIQECLTPLPARGGGAMRRRERAGSWGEGRGGREVVRYVEMVREGRGRRGREGTGDSETPTEFVSERKR